MLFVFYLLVVDVGFVQSVYTFSEPDTSAMVCIEVKQGILGLAVDFSLTSRNASAQGTCITKKSTLRIE